jgi:hypothetical protein
VLGKVPLDAAAAHRPRVQDFRLLDHMTTYENVALPFRVRGAQLRDGAVELLHWVGLGSAWALPPVLSGGSARRFACRDCAPQLRSPTSRPAMSILTWRNACCACSSRPTVGHLGLIAPATSR